MAKRHTRDSFIEKANIKHQHKYDYSKVDYVNNSTKVCIICPIHGEFWQTPGNHMSGQSCPKCCGRGYTKEEMVQRFKNVHGDKYDYSKVEFVRTDRKVCIICPIHGEFWQEPRLHLKGMGCRYCAGKDMTNDEFIRRSQLVHGDKYDYSKVDYVNNSTKVCIICPIHGEFWQTPGNHINGKNGCPKCGYIDVHNKTNLKKEDFLVRAQKIHGDKYDYTKVDYYNIDTKVCIICPIHGEFWQTPYKHMTMGQGCPKCGSSHLENDIRNLLVNNNINFEEQKTFEWLKYYKNLRLDFYLPDYNVAIECQGIQHFQPVDFYNNGKKSTTTDYILTVKRDKIKKRLCEEHNIKIFYYSNVDIVYPYNVYINKELLLNEIKLN